MFRFPISALTLLVARITRADHTDRPVALDDLAKFASALYRRSDFHDFPHSLSTDFDSKQHKKHKLSVTTPYPQKNNSLRTCGETTLSLRPARNPLSRAVEMRYENIPA